jgi:hypothetical protein
MEVWKALVLGALGALIFLIPTVISADLGLRWIVFMTTLGCAFAFLATFLAATWE